MRKSQVLEIEDFLNHRKETSVQLEPETEPVAADEPLPEFPRLPGPLGKLVEAVTADLAYDHKALAAITYAGVALSGKVRIKSEPFLQPRFYACSVGNKGTGKSSAEKEVARALLPLMPHVEAELSIDSGPALVQLLREHPRVIYRPDEVADAFEKARQTANSRNSLLGEFLRLYESNETGRNVIERNGGRAKVENAHFALCGSATTDRFPRMWQGTSGAATGLQSRFVLSYSEKPLPAVKTGNDEVKLVEVKAELESVLQREDALDLSLSDEAQDAIFWWTFGVDLGEHTRVLDMAKRFAMVVAATCGESEITRETMEIGLRFADYQIALYGKLMSADAASFVQAFENKILSFYRKNPSRTERDCRNSIKPDRCPGGYGAFNQALGNLKKGQALVKSGENRVGTELWIADAA